MKEIDQVNFVGPNFNQPTLGSNWLDCNSMSYWRVDWEISKVRAYWCLYFWAVNVLNTRDRVETWDVVFGRDTPTRANQIIISFVIAFKPNKLGHEPPSSCMNYVGY